MVLMEQSVTRVAHLSSSPGAPSCVTQVPHLSQDMKRILQGLRRGDERKADDWRKLRLLWICLTYGAVYVCVYIYNYIYTYN